MRQAAGVRFRDARSRQRPHLHMGPGHKSLPANAICPSQTWHESFIVRVANPMQDATFSTLERSNHMGLDRAGGPHG